MRARKDKFPFLAEREPWMGDENAIWLASTLTLYRNLKHYVFPGKLTDELSQEIEKSLSQELLKSPQLKNPYIVKAEETGPLEKEFLFEHFLLQKSFQQAMRGESFLLDGTGRHFGLINVGNHLQLQITDCHGELETALGQLVAIETDIGRLLPFAFSPRFGFLTADPALAGTGLLVRIFLHTPALIRTGLLKETLDQLGGGEIEAMSIQGATDEIIGDILVIQNRSTLGVTEEQILQLIRTHALKIIVAEKAMRVELGSGKNTEIKDRVGRAFGLLRHSYQLEAVETWGALSLIKLGLDLGWVEGTSHAVLNDLLITSRRAHLVCEYTEDIPHDAIGMRRAEYVHASLGDTHLTI